jgi:hypothetical protein
MRTWHLHRMENMRPDNQKYQTKTMTGRDHWPRKGNYLILRHRIQTGTKIIVNVITASATKATDRSFYVLKKTIQQPVVYTIEISCTPPNMKAERFIKPVQKSDNRLHRVSISVILQVCATNENTTLSFNRVHWTRCWSESWMQSQ